MWRGCRVGRWADEGRLSPLRASGRPTTRGSPKAGACPLRAMMANSIPPAISPASHTPTPMSAFARLRLCASRHASLIWVLVLAYAAMPLAQALQPQTQWLDVPYCAGVIAPTPASALAPPAVSTPHDASAAPGLAKAQADAGNRGAVVAAAKPGHAAEQRPAPAHAHVLLLFTPNACPAGQAQQAALPTAAPALPQAAICAAFTTHQPSVSQPARLSYARPQPRAPPALPTAA